MRSALTRALNRTGAFSVVPAEHGRHALDILAGERVHAILTDLQMPVMDGLTMIGHLFEREIRLPVAVMTGYPIAPELAQRLQSYGIAASFTKPLDVGTLADELQRSLDPETVGRIRGITLFGFLQLLEVERKTAVVVVHGPGTPGRCYFEDGHLVHAHTRRRTGREAVYEILGWSDPTVEIFYNRRPRERTVQEPLQHVLMEAARLLDEGQRDAGAAGEDAADPTSSRLLPAEPGAGEAPPTPRFDGRIVRAALEELLGIDGAVAAALVHAPSGMTLGEAGGTPSLSLELAATMAADLVRAKQRALSALQVDDAIEDIMITLGKQYYLIRFLEGAEDVFLYLVLGRERANLGMARHQLARIARRFGA